MEITSAPKIITESAETYAGTRTNEHWSTRIDGCIQSYPDEETARSEFARRTKYMHRGKTAKLERMVNVETWVMHVDVLERIEK